MSNAIVPWTDQERMANAIAKSGLFGLKSPDQVLALMAVAQAEGRHPGSVARDYHIIQGRPALRADAMLARFQQAGGTVNWLKYADDEVTRCSARPSPSPPSRRRRRCRTARRTSPTASSPRRFSHVVLDIKAGSRNRSCWKRQLEELPACHVACPCDLRGNSYCVPWSSHGRVHPRGSDGLPTRAAGSQN